MYICIHMICSHSNGEFTPVEGNKPISREIHKNNLENTLEKTHNKHDTKAKHGKPKSLMSSFLFSEADIFPEALQTVLALYQL